MSNMHDNSTYGETFPSMTCNGRDDLLDLRAMLGFERWQSANKGLPLVSVIDHLGGIDGVEASRMEIMFD